jgi:hypothetical protein
LWPLAAPAPLAAFDIIQQTVVFGRKARALIAPLEQKRKLFAFEACLTLPPEISILFYSYPRIKILRFITIDQFKRKNTVNFKLLAVIASVTALQSTTASAQLNCEPPSMLICQIGRCFCDVPREIVLEGVNIRIIVLDEGFAKPVEMDKELQEKLEIAIKEMR